MSDRATVIKALRDSLEQLREGQELSAQVMLLPRVGPIQRGAWSDMNLAYGATVDAINEVSQQPISTVEERDHMRAEVQRLLAIYLDADRRATQRLLLPEGRSMAQLEDASLALKHPISLIERLGAHWDAIAEVTPKPETAATTDERRRESDVSLLKAGAVGVGVGVSGFIGASLLESRRQPDAANAARIVGYVSAFGAVVMLAVGSIDLAVSATAGGFMRVSEALKAAIPGVRSEMRVARDALAVV